MGKRKKVLGWEGWRREGEGEGVGEGEKEV